MVEGSGWRINASPSSILLRDADDDEAVILREDVTVRDADLQLLPLPVDVVVVPAHRQAVQVHATVGCKVKDRNEHRDSWIRPLSIDLMPPQEKVTKWSATSLDTSSHYQLGKEEKMTTTQPKQIMYQEQA